MTVKRPLVFSLLIGLMLVGLIVVYLTSQLKVVSDMGQFMPAARQDPQLQALLSEIQNGPAATALMVRLYGAEPDKLAKLSKTLRNRLRADNVFREVRNGNGATDWRVVESLFPHRYLIGNEIDWSAKGLQDTFSQRLRDLRSGAGPALSDFLTTDPHLSFLSYVRGLLDLTGPLTKHGVWFASEYQSALMLIQVRSEGLDIEKMQIALENINGSFAELAAESNIKVEIAGPGVMAVETKAAIEQVMKRMTIFIIVMLAAVFIYAYRSLYLLMLAGFLLSTSVGFALVATQMMFGVVHSIVLVFGITLLGVCLDYPLHLFSHCRQSESASTSLNLIWPTLRLSGISSILAFLALLGSGFDGLSQLAIFAACGLTMALLLTRYGLANFLSADRATPRLWNIHLSLKSVHKAIISILLLSAPIFIIAQTGNFWEDSIEAISPIPASARESDRRLRHALNVPEVSHVFINAGDSVDEVLASSETLQIKLNELKALGIIKSIWSPSQVLPSIATQQQRQSKIPSAKQLQRNLESSLETLPFKPAAFVSWLDVVSTSKKLAPLSYADMSATVLADALRQGLFQSGEQWLAVTRIGGIRSDVELNGWLENNLDVSDSHVHIKTATEGLLIEYRRTTFQRLIAVAIVLAIIVAIWSRSVMRTVWVLLPVGIGIGSGIMVPLLIGTSINVFHLLALLLVFGMGLDYSLFFNRTGGDMLETQQRLHAISISALTTAAAFSILAFSTVPVLAAIGQTVSAGVIACFVSAWLLAGAQQSGVQGAIV